MLPAGEKSSLIAWMRKESLIEMTNTSDQIEY